MTYEIQEDFCIGGASEPYVLPDDEMAPRFVRGYLDELSDAWLAAELTAGASGLPEDRVTAEAAREALEAAEWVAMTISCLRRMAGQMLAAGRARRAFTAAIADPDRPGLGQDGFIRNRRIRHYAAMLGLSA